MRLLFLYLKNKKSNIIQVVLVYVVLLLVIWLYNLPYYEAFSFGIELYGSLYIVYFIYDYSVFADKIRTLERNIKTDDIQNIALPDKKNDVEALYADIIIKLHEQKRKQYDAGVEASRNLKDYYACWAHQIKTPIAAAKLIIQSLDDVVRNLENNSLGNSYNESYDEHYDDFKNNESNEKNDDNDLEKLDRKLNELSHEMFRIEFYTDAVMDYLRLEDISSDYEFKLCRLDVAVKKVVKKFAPQFIGRHISLHIEQIEDSVCTDSKWLGFIIEQLISNAVKYTDNYGNIQITVIQENENVVITVKDNGCGIDDNDIQYIFERFYRTDKSRNRSTGGAGIGLTITRAIVQLHGGTIHVESKKGVGSLFKVTIPANKQI